MLSDGFRTDFLLFIQKKKKIRIVDNKTKACLFGINKIIENLVDNYCKILNEKQEKKIFFLMYLKQKVIIFYLIKCKNKLFVMEVETGWNN